MSEKETAEAAISLQHSLEVLTEGGGPLSDETMAMILEKRAEELR